MLDSGFDIKSISNRIVVEGMRDELLPLTFKNTDINKFQKSILAGLCEHAKVNISINDESNQIERFSIYSHSNNRFYFNYSVEDDAVHMGLANVASKGLGVSKQVQRNVFEFLRREDVQKINVSANNMGAYVWARMGFAPNEYAWQSIIKPNLGYRVDVFKEALLKKNDKKGLTIIKEITEHLEKDDPKAIWDIVDNKEEFSLSNKFSWGQAMTIPASNLQSGFNDIRDLKYIGELSFADSKSVDRAANYLYPETSEFPELEEDKTELLNVARFAQEIATSSARLGR